MRYATRTRQQGTRRNRTRYIPFLEPLEQRAAPTQWVGTSGGVFGLLAEILGPEGDYPELALAVATSLSLSDAGGSCLDYCTPDPTCTDLSSPTTFVDSGDTGTSGQPLCGEPDSADPGPKDFTQGPWTDSNGDLAEGGGDSPSALAMPAETGQTFATGPNSMETSSAATMLPIRSTSVSQEALLSALAAQTGTPHATATPAMSSLPINNTPDSGNPPPVASQPGTSPGHDTASAGNQLANLPLRFEPNVGQVANDQVQFLSHGNDFTLFVSPTEANLVLPSAGAPQPIPGTGTFPGSAHLPPQWAHSDTISTNTGAGTMLSMDLVGANANAQGEGVNPLVTRTNYLIGNDPSQWHTGVANYGGVTYANVYNGIDVTYYGANQHQLEYDFLVHPGADPRAIQLAFNGSTGLTLDAQGNLHVQTAGGDVVQHAPNLYQVVNGARQSVAGSFVLLPEDRVGFTVGAHDPTLPVTIDPTVVYTTYLGGTGVDEAHGIAVDSLGDAYVCGETTSAFDFPTTPGTAQPTTHKGEPDMMFVSELNPAGTALIYSTYLGGSWVTCFQIADSIAVDAFGNAYVAGVTDAPDFPTTPGAFETDPPIPEGGVISASLTKFDPTGNFVYSTYVHPANGYGAGEEWAGVAVDAAGSAYLATASGPYFPLVNPFQTAGDCIIAKFTPDGSSLLYSSYFGTDMSQFPPNGPMRGEQVFGIALDQFDNVYITGMSDSPIMPTVNAIQPNLAGTVNAFVVKVNSTGTGLVYATYLGGGGDDWGFAIAADEDGNAYVAGMTDSPNFPTTPGAYQTGLTMGSAAFVTRFEADGSALDYSTLYGGDYNTTSANGITVDQNHNAVISGSTNGYYEPMGPPASQQEGNAYAYAAIIDPLGEGVTDSTTLGGTYNTGASCVAILPQETAIGAWNSGTAPSGTDDVYLAGTTQAPDLPTTVDAFQKNLAGMVDAFVQWVQLNFIPIIDVIPNNMSNETQQNSEPNIAVNPTNDNQMVISSFGNDGNPRGGPHPYFTSTNGGLQWAQPAVHRYTQQDVTLAWSSGGTAYDARQTANNTFQVDSSANPTAPVAFNAVPNSPLASVATLDRPQIAVTRSGGTDRVYVGFNDFGVPNGRSASIWYTTNAGAANPAWTRQVLETVNPAGGQDYSPFPAASGNTVDVVFARRGAAAGGDANGDIVFVSDTNGGANNFTNVNTIVSPAGTVIPRPVAGGTMLGANERLTAGAEVAIDPNNAQNVYVAYTDVNAGAPRVRVYFSNNGGANRAGGASSWTRLYDVANAAIPSLAVSANGTVGLMYVALNGNRLETHFTRTKNNFTNVVDAVLSRFPDGAPARVFPPYLGDYEGLVSVGNFFEGTFSASNDPQMANFPRGVFYQRNIRVGGAAQANQVLNANTILVDAANAAVNRSIDPFFYWSFQLP